MGQYTLAEKISCTGIGLHSGAPVQLTLSPARADSGVVFVRTDLPDPVEIPARSKAIASSRMATTLGCGGATVSTVEHLLAALYGLAIDNVRIGVDGPELPVMDGSAAPFVYLIRSAGTFEQSEPRRVLSLRRPIEVANGERRIRIEPARGLHIHYAVEFAHPAIRRQEFSISPVDAPSFEREISAARTFGFLDDVDELWRSGLGRGGSLANTVLLDERGLMNPEGLRWPDEFARHKVLDLLGDLALLGMPVEGRIHVERGGHALHQELVSAMVDAPDAWRNVDADRPRKRTRRAPRGAAAARGLRVVEGLQQTP